MKTKLTTRLILGLGVAAVTTVITASLVLALKGKAFAENRYTEIQVFMKVLNLIEKFYVEEVDTKKLIYGSIKGMLRELDPHTNFLPPDVYEEFESETSGKFGGLGIEITIQKGILVVISPIEDSPAWKAGIKAGDKIVEIEGTATKGLSLVDAAQKMRGPKGSKIKLTIMRDGFDKPRDFIVNREVIKLTSIKYMDLDEGYAYYKVTNFVENTAEDLEKALVNHDKKYKAHKGAIVDLRGNPGGILEQAAKVSDLFLDKGIIVSTIPREDKGKEVMPAHKLDERSSHKDYVGFPLIVLINEYSASASEIVAGALQDNQRAIIMGQRSFGKGTVQTVVKLGDGSALKMTTARYFTPSGKSIQAEGIHPDVVLEQIDPEALEKSMVQSSIMREQDMDRHLTKGKKRAEKLDVVTNPTESFLYWWNQTKGKDNKDLTTKQILLGKDFQAAQAYNYLKAWRVMRTFAEPRAETKAQTTPEKVE